MRNLRVTYWLEIPWSTTMSLVSFLKGVTDHVDPPEPVRASRDRQGTPFDCDPQALTSPLHLQPLKRSELAWLTGCHAVS